MRHDETTNFYYVQYTYCISIRIKILVILSFILKLLWTYIFGFQPGDFEKKTQQFPLQGLTSHFVVNIWSRHARHFEPWCAPCFACAGSIAVQELKLSKFLT